MDDTRQVPFEELEHRAVQAEQRAVEAQKKTKETFVVIATAALDAIAVRSRETARVFLSLFFMAGLFGYALYDPSAMRVAAATIFGGLLILAGMFKRWGDVD